MSNKVYTGAYNWSVAPGLTVSSNFSIRSTGKEIKLKSVTIDWHIEDAAGLTVPWRTATQEFFSLGIGTLLLTTGKIAYTFTPTGGAPPYYNGSYFRITEPKQLIFDSFFIANELPFYVQISNLSGAFRTFWLSIAAETEEKTMFQQT